MTLVQLTALSESDAKANSTSDDKNKKSKAGGLASMPARTVAN